MDDDSKYSVPLNLDAPIPFFAWEFIDIIVAMMFAGLGILMEMFLLGFMGMIVVLVYAKKLRQGQKRGQVQHLFWRMGINIDKPLKKNAGNPLILEYFE